MKLIWKPNFHCTWDGVEQTLCKPQRSLMTAACRRNSFLKVFNQKYPTFSLANNYFVIWNPWGGVGLSYSLSISVAFLPQALCLPRSNWVFYIGVWTMWCMSHLAWVTVTSRNCKRLNHKYQINQVVWRRCSQRKPSFWFGFPKEFKGSLTYCQL